MYKSPPFPIVLNSLVHISMLADSPLRHLSSKYFDKEIHMPALN